ncbi:MAG: SMP-30/gluconolactonase/LRE family protein [Rhodospirillales bacterium]|nr:MAG: SMP-30/gluconolactonase/LRE family protein [Rhodospirillales bacterium]
MAAKLETVMDGLTFAEGPRWHDGRLWFSDFYSHRVIAVEAGGKSETIVEVPQRPSGLGWTPAGDLLIVSMLDRALLRFAGGRLSPYADLSALATGPCNDMVVDAKGRCYVGNFGFDRHKGEAQRTTCLARVDPDGTVSRAADDLMFPNGTVITPDGRTMVVAETFGSKLTAFDVAADGTLSNRRLFADLPGIFPDGICLDAEGGVWVTDARGPDTVRVFDGGRIAERIPAGEGRHAFACMLGGADRRTLYLCTNVASGPAVAEKRAGRIDAVRVDVPGAGLP